MAAGGGRHGACLAAAEVDALRQPEGAGQAGQPRVVGIVAIAGDHGGGKVAQRGAAAVHIHQRLYARQQAGFQRGRDAFRIAARRLAQEGAIEIAAIGRGEPRAGQRGFGVDCRQQVDRAALQNAWQMVP
ncbi:hypothetical protein D9M68_708170 [compost metagenome]